MMEAAQKMMGNLSPEQLEQASQQAQKQMANMSPADIAKMGAQMGAGGMPPMPSPAQMSKEEMADAANKMNSMSPDEMKRMVEDLKTMSDAEKDAMRAAGMDPAMLETMMEAAQANPGMLQVRATSSGEDGLDDSFGSGRTTP
jgi:aromatic ring hydroxylase